MSDLVKRLREDFRGCPFPSVYTTCNEAADEIERLQAENATAVSYATGLARGIQARHYREVTAWKPLTDIVGLLTQIDNMTSGLVRADFPKEPDK